MKYRVFFNISGKKLKTTVEADSVYDAKEKVLAKVVFDEIKQVKEFTDKDVKDFFHGIQGTDSFNNIKDMFGFK